MYVWRYILASDGQIYQETPSVRRPYLSPKTYTYNHFWSNTTQHVLHTTILYLQQHLRFGTSVQQIAVTGRYVTLSISALLRNLVELWVPKKQWYTPLSIEKQEILSWAALLHTWTLSSHIWIIFDKSHVISAALTLF